MLGVEQVPEVLVTAYDNAKFAFDRLGGGSALFTPEGLVMIAQSVPGLLKGSPAGNSKVFVDKVPEPEPEPEPVELEIGDEISADWKNAKRVGVFGGYDEDGKVTLHELGGKEWAIPRDKVTKDG
jgi:hypothetical protein